jgi:hypothetical protein
MPRTCTVCRLPAVKRQEAEEALISGGTFRDLAGRFSVSRMALHRHKKSHLSAKLRKAERIRELASTRKLGRFQKVQESRELEGAVSLADRLQGLEHEARRLKEKAETGGDLKTALQAVRELTRLCELAGRISGELQQQAAVQINLVGLDPHVRAFVEDRDARDFLVACSKVYRMTPEELRQLVEGRHRG